MSNRAKEEDIGQIIKGLKVDVSRTQIERELQARLERKEARIVELEGLVDTQMAENSQRVFLEEEQKRKDEASLRAQPTGGGKVPLPRESGGKGFDSGYEMIRDLYDRAEAGSKEAEYDIANLWKLTKGGLEQMEREGFSISGCPRCEAGLLRGTTICPNCRFDLESSGYTKYGELW